MILPTDLVFVLSGGMSNMDPTQSLGGYPSAMPVGNNIDNLFQDLSNGDLTNGSVNYRCIYVFNDSITDSFFHVNVFTQGFSANGAQVYIGMPIANEQQVLNFGVTPTSGSFSLNFDIYTTEVIPWSSNMTVMAASIQAALVLLPNLSSTTVTAISHTQYVISFAGESANRSLPLLRIAANSLLPPTAVNAVKSVPGSPINSIASLQNNETTAPAGITFVSSQNSPIPLGTLGPTEGFPVWIQRVVPANFNSIGVDGFNLLVNVASEE